MTSSFRMTGFFVENVFRSKETLQCGLAIVPGFAGALTASVFELWLHKFTELLIGDIQLDPASLFLSFYNTCRLLKFLLS